MSARAPLRPVSFGPVAVETTRAPDGTVHLRSRQALGDYPRALTARLVHWAQVAPDRICLAARDRDERWRELSYADVLVRVRALGQALLDRGLSEERPLVILSENGLEHALLALAAMHVGVPYAPISPAYSLVSTDFARLRHILGLLRPGLVFAADGMRHARAVDATLPPETELVVADHPSPGRRAGAFADLQNASAGADVDRAHARVGPDTVAKILFTSGSTGRPKCVINTQRMLCSNQQMILQSFAFLGEVPPVLVDWSPWHHTAGGNHQLGITIYNGGSFYIDEGKPVPGGIEKTVRNLREVAPTFYFNVPKGYEELVPHLRREPDLRRKFFSRVSALLYAGAAMSQHVWDALDEIAVEACGERIALVTGLGSTETAPAALFSHWDTGGKVGVIGLPLPGLEAKLVPTGEKLEVRLKGPSITPGYWRDDAQTRAAFDEEGYYRMGDAVRLVEPGDPRKGLLFDGRIAEDFKLSTGTWVSVGELRAQLILEGAPYVQDAVIAAPGRDEIAALVFPNVAACRGLCRDLGADAAIAEVLAHPAVRSRMQQVLDGAAARSTGSSNRVARALLLEAPASLDRHEITDKGSINQRAVLENRADLVEELYAQSRSARVLIAAGKGEARAA
jgi:feruloyl-CoA synthase